MNLLRQWEFAAPLPHAATIPTRTMTYNDDNQLLTFKEGTGSTLTVGSDADGNLTNAPLTNATLATYAYDARNRLLNVGGVTNAYDPMNNRIGQTQGTNSTIFVVNPNAALPQVLMRIKNGVTNYYIYGAGLLYQITETATATNTLTYHYDYRGSTVALTDNNGNVTDRIEYSLYATTTYRTGTNDTPFLFNGRYGVQTDANGLLYMRARYYSPYLCRFINADPSGFAGGLNFYAYANGNPVSYLDAFGLNAHATSDTFFSWLPNASLNFADPFGLALGNPEPDWIDKALDFGAAYAQASADREAERLARLTPMERQIDEQINMLPMAGGLSRAAAEMGVVGLGSLTPAQARQIQAFSDRFGTEVNVVGSRATGGGLTSDFDYVIGGNSSVRHSANYYLPKGPVGTGAGGRGIDIFNANLTPLDPTRPFIQFTPKLTP